jgi:hypothetical protein
MLENVNHEVTAAKRALVADANSVGKNGQAAKTRQVPELGTGSIAQTARLIS